MVARGGHICKLEVNITMSIGCRVSFTKRMAEAVESEKVELISLVDGAYVQRGLYLQVRSKDSNEYRIYVVLQKGWPSL